jgi:hypothetical protein
MSIINWVIDNWTTILQIYAGIVAVASIVVRLTPDLRDDTVLLAIVKFVAKYIALNTEAPLDKDRPK